MLEHLHTGSRDGLVRSCQKTDDSHVGDHGLAVVHCMLIDGSDHCAVLRNHVACGNRRTGRTSGRPWDSRLGSLAVLAAILIDAERAGPRSRSATYFEGRMQVDSQR